MGMEVFDLSLEANSDIKPSLQKVRNKTKENSCRGAWAYLLCLPGDPQSLHVLAALVPLCLMNQQSSSLLDAEMA